MGRLHQMSKAAQINANHVSGSPAEATVQHNQQSSQPEGPSMDAATQSASDVSSLLHESVDLDQVELGLVSRFIAALSEAHQCSGLREERDTLYQQLALLQRSRCTDTAVLERLKELDARTSGRAELQAVFDSMDCVAELLRSAAALAMTPAAASLQLSEALAAERAGIAAVWGKVGNKTAGVVNNTLEAQARYVSQPWQDAFVRSMHHACLLVITDAVQGIPDVGALKATVDTIRQALYSLREGASDIGQCEDFCNVSNNWFCMPVL